MAHGTQWVPHFLTFQEQGLQRDDPPEPIPTYTLDQKAYKCYWHKGTPPYAWAGTHVHLVHHLCIQGRLSVYAAVRNGGQLNVINIQSPSATRQNPSSKPWPKHTARWPCSPLPSSSAT